jgi:hypothetical protein
MLVWKLSDICESVHKRYKDDISCINKDFIPHSIRGHASQKYNKHAVGSILRPWFINFRENICTHSPAGEEVPIRTTGEKA